MRRMPNSLVLLLLGVLLIASACTSRQEPNESSVSDSSASSSARTTETSEPNQSADIFYYDPNECASPDPDATADLYCGPVYEDAMCDVLEAKVDDGEGLLVVGDNAMADLARVPATWAPNTSLWTLAVYSQVDDMPSVYITLEEMPGNEFGYVYRTPRLEWSDGTVSELTMTGIGTPTHDADEPTIYNMEFADQDGGQLYVSVAFDCRWG